MKFGRVMILRRALFVCFLFSFIINAHAQTTINFHHINAKEALSQASVMCILQDNKGFMWFGTQNGLDRYDGYNMKVFKHNPSDSTSLINSFIFGLYEDNSGNMYVETRGGGFQKYDPLNEVFEKFDKSRLTFKDVRFNTVSAFFVDTTGVQWSGGLSASTGLKRTDTTGKITVYKHNPSDPSSLGDDRVFSIYRDRSGNLWVGTMSGLDKLNEKTGKFTHYINKPGDPNSLSDNWVWSILEDEQGYLWIGTARGGLNRFNPKTGIFKSFKNDPLNSSSISDNWIFSIYQDKSGILWMGTNTGGVNYFLPSVQVFTIYRARPGDKSWFGDNAIQSICAGKNEIYWIGTHNDGIYRLDYKEDKFKNYPFNPSSSNSISSSRIQSMYVDNSGILWVGNFNGGLDALDPQTNTVKHFKNNPTDTNSISDNRIYSIIQGNNGNIWIGTYGGGLNELDPKTGKITRYRHDDNNPNSISSDKVYSVAEDHSGLLWLGLPEAGINSFDPVSKKATLYKNIPGNPESLLDNYVVVIYVDSKNNIWAGTTQGLSELNRKTKKFTNYKVKDGMPNENVWGILEDGRGFIWISTSKGLSRFNPETKTFKNFYEQDGLQGNEFNQNAYAKDNHTGRMLFGGNNGFNIFDPSKIKNNNFMPPVVFTDYTRYNTDNKGGEPIIENGISEMDSLKLSYKDNIIKLKFAALNYYNTPENQYKYQLEGLNNNWIQLDNNNSVTFTNLSPGDYTLRVAGSNNDGIWNEKGASLFIEVTPPWWKTKIAYIIYFIFFLGILYVARRIDLNRREQKAKIRENELQLKATEAEKRAIQAENDRKTKELEKARQLQLSMLPKDLPDLPNLEVAAFMRTATEVGGDYYDFIVDENKVLNVAFGDATGHGLEAGTMVTLMKGFFTSDSARFKIDQFMNHCTGLIKEIKLGRILMSFTFLRIENKKMNITSAGMPPIYYFNKSTGETERILVKGMPLGAMRKYPYKMIDKELKTDDKILLFTDGLPEQENKEGKMFDYERVKEYFHEYAEMEPKIIIDKLVEKFDEWKGDVKQADDISFVAIKVK